MLQIKHGIVVANSRLQQALRVISGRWIDDLDAWRMEKPGFGTGGMERAAVCAAARGAANDHRRRDAAAPVHLARHIDELVEAAGDEVDKLHLGNGSHAHNGCSDGAADNSVLGHRRINHPLRPKFIQEARAHLERAAVSAHVLAEQEYSLVTAHLFAHSLADCFKIGYCCHRCPTPSNGNTSDSAIVLNG